MTSALNDSGFVLNAPPQSRRRKRVLPRDDESGRVLGLKVYNASKKAKLEVHGPSHPTPIPAKRKKQGGSGQAAATGRGEGGGREVRLGREVEKTVLPPIPEEEECKPDELDPPSVYVRYPDLGKDVGFTSSPMSDAFLLSLSGRGSSSFPVGNSEWS